MIPTRYKGVKLKAHDIVASHKVKLAMIYAPLITIVYYFISFYFFKTYFYDELTKKMYLLIFFPIWPIWIIVMA